MVEISDMFSMPYPCVRMRVYVFNEISIETHVLARTDNVIYIHTAHLYTMSSDHYRCNILSGLKQSRLSSSYLAFTISILYEGLQANILGLTLLRLVLELLQNSSTSTQMDQLLSTNKFSVRGQAVCHKLGWNVTQNGVVKLVIKMV